MSVRDYLTEGAMQDDAFIKEVNKIAKMTDRNDHSGAAIAGAKLMKKVGGKRYDRVLTIFTHLQGLHDAFGSMPYELGQLRFRVLQDMWTMAGNDLSEYQATAFKGAY